MQEITRVRALCCECGNLRTTAARWSRRGDAGRSYENPHDPRGWRMTRTIKCSACKTMTVHALLCDDRADLRDMAEERQWPTREELMQISSDIAGRVGLEDLTTDELRQLIALLRAAEARIDAG